MKLFRGRRVIAMASALILGLGTWGAVAATTADAVTSPVGTYNWSDTVGDTFGVTINGDGTWVFPSVECSGQWIMLGSTITLADTTGACGWFMASGKLSAKSMNKPDKPGVLQFGGTNAGTGTWYALRCGAPTKVTCIP